MSWNKYIAGWLIAIALLFGWVKFAFGNHTLADTKADFRSLIAVCLAMEINATPADPVVPPAPTPAGDTCPNCNGAGKVGDGRVFVTCPECGGTGKKKHASTDLYQKMIDKALKENKPLYVFIRCPMFDVPDAIVVQIDDPEIEEFKKVLGIVVAVPKNGAMTWTETLPPDASLYRLQQAVPKKSSFNFYAPIMQPTFAPIMSAGGSC